MTTRRTGWLLIAAIILSIAATGAAQASVSGMMNYQGRLSLAAGDPLATGVYCMQFQVYTAASGGSTVWAGETHATVSVIEGAFNVVLGASNSLSGVFTDPARYLGIRVGANCGALGAELTPRQQVLPAPVAMHAETAETSETSETLVGPVSTQDNGFGQGLLEVNGTSGLPKAVLFSSFNQGYLYLRNSAGSVTTQVNSSSVSAPSASFSGVATISTVVAGTVTASTSLKVPINSTTGLGAPAEIGANLWAISSPTIACNSGNRGEIRVHRVNFAGTPDALCWCGKDSNSGFNWACIPNQ